MDLVTKLLNIIVPPLTFILVCILSPPFHLLKFFYSLLHYIHPEDVAGKVVVITGASSGIGEELAYEYARRGAFLVLAARREKSLHKVADKCLEFGSPVAITVTADVSSVDDCKKIVDSTISHFNKLDHLVCNAGISSVTMFEDYSSVTTPRCIMDVNFWGAVYITRFAIPYLRNAKGKIIAISSVASWIHAPRLTAYNASKAAMVAFYETLRAELGSDIHIAIVTPGLVESELTKGKHFSKEGQMNVDQKSRDEMVGIMPVTKAEDCAKAIVNGACRGQKLQYATDLGHSLNKKILNLPGVKAILQPSTIWSPDIKTE